jgi:hypothetical protein
MCKVESGQTKMKKIITKILTILVMVLFVSAVFAQKSEYINGTEQIGNHNFENFDNLGAKEEEPTHWNSFMTNTGSIASLARSKQVERSDQTRPGSTGQYSARIYSRSVVGVSANGNLTTGRINAGSTTPSSDDNYNFTDRNAEAHCHPFVSIPDSLVVWLKFNPNNASHEGSFEVIFHNNNNTRAPKTNTNEVVAYANAFFGKKNAEWQRISIPFDKKPNTDVRFCLINITTNKTPGGGGSSDELFIDDLLFVYNPTLTLNSTPSSIALAGGLPATFNVSYTLTGTMNPYNNLPDNKVIVELSDANGSFATPRVIGEVTASTSGTVACSVPYDIERGTGYRIRLRSTNYPKISPDNGTDIEIYGAFLINAAPADHRGTVSGNKGIQRLGTTVSLTASANQGNKFVNWSENGSIIAGEPVYTFIVDRDRNLVANFDTSSYQFTLSSTTGGVVDGGGGIIQGSPAGEYIHNSAISLQAVANTGYEFSGYFENNIQIASSSDFSFLITKNRNIEARFIARKYLVNLSSNNTLYGSVTGGGMLNYNSEILLSAKANPYCKFIAWVSNGDTLGKLPDLNYTVTQGVSITAVFAEIRYPVYVNRNPAQGGTVSGAGTYSAFNANTTITLTASSEHGYSFKYFTDDSTGAVYTQNPFVFLSGSRLTSAKSFTANFELRNYNITVGVLPVASGSVSGAGAFVHGTNVTLNAVAGEGYEFVAWLYGTSDTVSKSSQISFTASRDTALNAIFRLRRYNVNVINNDETFGEVSESGVYEHFSQISLTSVANEGYEFRSWVIDGEIIDSVSPFIYTVTGEVSIEANFSIIRKNVTAKVLPLGAGTVSGAGRFEHNGQVILTANANTGYSFTGWEDLLGNPLGIDAQTLYFNAVSDTCLVARFAPVPYTITISSGSGTNGEVSFDGISYSSSAIDSIIPFGTTLPIFASIVDEEYKFTGWKKLGTSEILSVEDTFYYTVTKDESLLAVFSSTAVSITVSAQPSDAGTVEGSGNYEKGSWYPVKAVPNYGYRVKEWQTVSGLAVGKEDSLMVYSDKDTSFVVLFEKDSFNVAFNVFPSQAGVISGEKRYCYEDIAVIKARSNDNYNFIGWYENGIEFSTDSVLEIGIDREYDLTARFDSNEISLTIFSSHPYNSTVSQSIRSKYGRSETLIATAGEGIHFIGWKYGNDTLSSDTLHLIMSENSTLTALFDTNKYSFKLNSSLNGCVDIIAGSSEINCTRQYVAELYYNTPVKIITAADYGYNTAFDTLSFVIKKDTVINIEFLENTVTVQASCDALKGYTSVSGGTSQLYGHEVSIEAVAYTGYNFVKWTLASDTTILFSKYPVVSFVAVRDTELVAHFESAKFEVSVETNNELAGTVSFNVGDSYAEIDTVMDFNSNITVNAHTLYGYHFLYWEIDGTIVSTDSVYQTSPIVGATSIIAVFEANLYNVQLVWEPSACGEAFGGGIYPYGSTIEIKGVAETNFRFDRWLSGSLDLQEFVSFDSVYSFVLTRDTVFTAVFRTDTFNIGVDIATVGGSVSGGGHFLLGQEVSVIADNEYGYVFSEWEDNNGNTVSMDNPYVFNASENISLHAVFVPQTFNIKINSNAANGADIRGAGNYRYGDYAYLLALSDDVYTFSYWEVSEKVAEDSIFTAEELLNNVLFYPVEKDLEIRAVYQIRQYNVSATASPVAGGSVFNTGTYAHGSSFVLEAKAAGHYHFVNWVYKGVVLSDKPQLSVDSLSGNMEFVAVFELDRYEITLSCNISAGGVLNGGGYYSYGDTATISVSLNPGYSLQEWLNKDFIGIGNETSLQYIVTGDNYITAMLKKEASSEDVSLGERVSIYPNPVSSLLYIDGALVSVGVFDFTGKEVMRSGSSPVDVSSLKAGVYVLRIEFSDGAVLTKKIVIN